MPPPKPIYTPENCAAAYQLNWSYSIFWTKSPDTGDWFSELRQACDPDSIRILQHAFKPPNMSQFLISTTPDVSPQIVAQRVKGRLQHLIRAARPDAFRRNYSIRNIGSTREEKLSAYLASQLEHHPMADQRVQERFAEYQIYHPDVDLSIPRYTSHATYIWNLHLALVADGRYREIRHEVLASTRKMIETASRAKGHLLSRAALLSDHIHMTMGCHLNEAPGSVATAYMNNLAYAQGMAPVFKFSFFAGTFGEYDLGVIPRDPA
jgi:REP element-mobilizing transposase RayT